MDLALEHAHPSTQDNLLSSLTVASSDRRLSSCLLSSLGSLAFAVVACKLASEVSFVRVLRYNLEISQEVGIAVCSGAVAE